MSDRLQLLELAQEVGMITPLEQVELHVRREFGFIFLSIGIGAFFGMVLWFL